MSAPKRQWEIATTGADEYLQLIGSDPFGSVSSVGLRVPFAPTTDPKKRYLFLLASFTLAEGEHARISGFRQLVTIGSTQSYGSGTSEGSIVIEQEVRSPFWRFQDGNVSWHINTVGTPNASEIPQTPGNGPVDCASFKQYWADGPALLYGPPAPPKPEGNVYTNVVDYVPPNGGKPYGTASDSKLGTMYDLRTQWLTHGGWSALDIPVIGPKTVAFFASVRQTNPETRHALVVPSPFYGGGLSPEEQFLLNFPGAQYWRVGGALRVEER
jgi:hypothetical protein